MQKPKKNLIKHLLQNEVAYKSVKNKYIQSQGKPILFHISVIHYFPIHKSLSKIVQKYYYIKQLKLILDYTKKGIIKLKILLYHTSFKTYFMNYHFRFY